jgi:hypothetical protein
VSTLFQSEKKHFYSPPDQTNKESSSQKYVGKSGSFHSGLNRDMKNVPNSIHRSCCWFSCTMVSGQTDEL